MDDFFKINQNIFVNNVNANNHNNSVKKNSYKGKMKMNINIGNNNIHQNRNSMRTYNQNFNDSFIIGKFGKKTVVSQNLNKFLNEIKKAEWTTNPSYLIAKDINIKTVFSNNNNKEYANEIPKYSSSIDKYYLHLHQINPNDFSNYINDIKNRKNNLFSESKREKEQFIRENFPNEGRIDVNSMLIRIRNNYQSFISKDQILYNKIFC